MPPDPPGGARPAGPVVLRIKLRYDDVDAMVSRFAPNVGKSGLFLPTKSLQPVGAEVKFELRLSNDTPVLLGLGRVKVIKPPDPANPKASFGMAIELMRVTRESRDLILRMLERRKELGLPEVQLPLPADLDAARRSDFVDTAVKVPVSAPIPTAAVDAQASEALLTAPRRPSGPVAVAKVTHIDPLPPEPQRPRRRGLAELIEAASGPIAAVTVPGLDDDVDVAAVLARARALAGGDLDRELAALSEVQAAPIEIDIEAASAELARQLGGKAVRRNPPTAWAPPPAIAEPEAAPVVIEPPVEAVAVEPPVEAIVDQPAAEEPAVVTAPAADEVDPVTRAGAVHAQVRADSNAERAEPEDDEDELDEGRHAMRTRMVSRDELAKAAAGFDAPSERFIPKPISFDAKDPVAPEPIDTLADPAAAAAALDDYETRTPISPHAVPTDDGDEEPEEHEVAPEQIHDEIHQLGEADYEEVEHTMIGAMPQPNAFEEHVFATTPSMQRELSNKLDEHLAAVEAEGEHDDLGIGEASGSYERAKVGLPPAQIYEGDDHPDEPEPEPELDPVAVAAQPVTLPPEYQHDFIHRFDEDGYEEPVVPPPIDAYGQTMDAGSLEAPDDEIQEIDDFEILAEADEEDEDLLSSSGEADASGQEQAVAPGDGELAMPDSDLELPPGVSDFSMPAAGDSDFVIPVQREPEFEMPPQRESDFAMRLDLGDDEPPPEPVPYASEPHGEPVPVGYQRPHSPSAVPQPMHLAASAGHALAAFDDDLDEASHSFTYADAPQLPSAIDFDDSARGFSPPSRFDQSDVIPLAPQHRSRTPSRHPDPVADPPTHEPYVLQGPPPAVSWDDDHSSRNRWASQSAPPPPSEEIDLESALEALDVDLDDLSSTPHGPTELARPTGQDRRANIRPPSSAQLPEEKRKSARIPRGRAPRASTEDGVLIDFDDDEER
jgi:Tfp pilus assembly protein PilZ